MALIERIPPPVGLMKINVDATISKNSCIVSVAAVVRDTIGSFFESFGVMEGAMEPETMEAMACKEGLSLASDLLLQKFRLASDCINVVRSIQGAGMGPYGHIIQEIKARVAGFQTVEFVHERRRSNGDAHNLAS
uniref:RNase H type-1 domain-containing protein n=1 Tax=Oryza punctata TaxID=4537 RepID=A0A0E0K3S1_ORYPU